MEGSNPSRRHEIIQMNTEMLNTISEKLQQAKRQTAQEKRREKEEAEAQVAAIEATLQQRRSREDYETAAKDRTEQLAQLLEETVKQMASRPIKES